MNNCEKYMYDCAKCAYLYGNECNARISCEECHNYNSRCDLCKCLMESHNINEHCPYYKEVCDA